MSRKILSLIAIGVILFSLTGCNRGKPVMDVILQNGEGDTLYQTVLDNGKIQKRDPFKQDPCRKYTVETLNFTHEIIDGKVHNQVGNAVITDENNQIADQEILVEIMNTAVEQIDHDIFTFEIYELDHEYFVFIELNVNMSDPCGLYYFDPDSGKLDELHVWQDVTLTGLQLRRE